MRFFIIITVALAAAGCSDGPPGERALDNGVRELRRGNFNAARVQFEKSIAARLGSEKNIEAYNSLGLACWQLGKTQDAIEAFESARRLSRIVPEATYNLAVLCAETSDPTRALQLLRDAALMDEKDPRPLEYMGSIYAKRQQWPEARRSFYAARSRAPTSARILTAIALIELATEKPETAVSTLQSALEHERNYGPALFNLGVIHQTRLNDEAKARAYFQRFIAVTNSGPQADYAKRALAALATQVAPPVKTATDIPPVEPVPPPKTTVTPLPPPVTPPVAPAVAKTDLLAQAADAAKQGRDDDALNLCLQAAKQASAHGDKAAVEKALRAGTQLCMDSPRAHTELGNFLVAHGQPDSALKSFKTALNLNENFSAAFLGLGKAATAAHEFDTALVGLKQAVQADPSSADALWLLAQLYDKNIDMPVGAIRSYSDFLKLFPSDGRAALARERMRTISATHRTATAANETATPVRTVPPPVVPAPATSTTTRTVVHIAPQPPSTLPATPKPDEVNPDIAAATRPASASQNPVAGRQAFSRGTEYQQRGDWNNAMEFFEQAVRNDEKLDAAWYNLGVGYSLRGESARAKDAYLRVLQIRPDHDQARYNLAVLYIDTKDNASAEKMLLDLVKQKPNYANAYLALGQVYARNAATLPQAKAAYQKFLELAPSDRAAGGVRQWLKAQ